MRYVMMLYKTILIAVFFIGGDDPVAYLVANPRKRAKQQTSQ